MINKFKNFFSILLLCILSIGAAGYVTAQTVGEGTTTATEAHLVEIKLPAGARRVKDGMAPREVTEVLTKLVAQGGERVRQGESEVLLWGGDFRGTRGGQMMKTLEKNLRGAGWQYERAAEENGVTIFVLLRETESNKRGAVGFFAPSEEAFIFAVSEMLSADGADAPQAADDSGKTNGRAIDGDPPKSSAGGTVSSKILGKWMRSVGAGRGDDGTGKTTYESGTNYTFEFSADGTMRFSTNTKVLSIMQCRTTETINIPGTYSINGSEITMNLGTGTKVGTSSCEKAGNFKQTLSASTLQKTFVVKELESIFRPDRPLMLCFDGAADDACYERLVK